MWVSCGSRCISAVTVITKAKNYVVNLDSKTRDFPHVELRVVGGSALCDLFKSALSP